MTDDELVQLFSKIGLDQVKAKETVGNKRLAGLLSEAIEKTQLKDCEKSVGIMMYKMCTTLPKNMGGQVSFLAPFIANKEIHIDSQLQAAINYLKNHSQVDLTEFKKESGFGVKVTDEMIEIGVAECISRHEVGLLEEKYGYDLGLMLKELRNDAVLKWADPKTIKLVFDRSIESMLGEKKATETTKKAKKVVPVEKTEDNGEWKFEGEVLLLHKPGENPQLNEEIRQKHLAATGGKVITRFPPEPNGYLHIGHAKAINFDFRYAQQHCGICYLRFDDTNPLAEEEHFFQNIKDMVMWLGFVPYKITHSSDYFDQLYDYAVQLIKKDKAYVCHQTDEEIKQSRGGEERGPRTNSPWRDRPIEESLKLFQDMKDGKFKEGEATLRLKMDMQSSNPNMWDLVAYRVLFAHHVRTVDKWCIYPMYDYTHPICDSIENVTHSFCTTEFILNRENYYWLCDALEIYKPVQWEMGRMNITHTVLSKRKIKKLIERGTLENWDDPRLCTLDGLKRRGIPPTAINNFVKKLGITTAISTIGMELLEACTRDELNNHAERMMVVLEPLKVTLIDFPSDLVEEFDVPLYPNDPSRGSRKMIFSRTIYIEHSDFRVDDDPNYKRLAPGKSVGLLYSKDATKPSEDKAFRITCTDYKTDSNDNVIEVIAICDRGHVTKKPSTFIHWVADCPRLRSPVPIEARLINNLFNSEDPMKYNSDTDKEAWLRDINPKSMVVMPKAMAELALRHAKPESHYQFFRQGYFTLDKVSTKEKLVFNRTVTLKEDSGVKKIRS